MISKMHFNFKIIIFFHSGSPVQQGPGASAPPFQRLINLTLYKVVEHIVFLNICCLSALAAGCRRFSCHLCLGDVRLYMLHITLYCTVTFLQCKHIRRHISPGDGDWRDLAREQSSHLVHIVTSDTPYGIKNCHFPKKQNKRHLPRFITHQPCNVCSSRKSSQDGLVHCIFIASDHVLQRGESDGPQS